MEIKDLIFALIEKFVPIPENKIRGLAMEAGEWRAKLDTDDLTKLNPIEKLYKKIHEPWIVRLLIAAFYIPIFRWIMKAQEPENFNTELQ